MCVALGSLPSRFRDQRLDVLVDRAEVAILGGAVDIDDGLRVAMNDDGGTEAASDAGETSENLLLAGRGHRQILQVLERGHAVLRRLCDEWVLQPCDGVQPERRRDLHAS